MESKMQINDTLNSYLQLSEHINLAIEVNVTLQRCFLFDKNRALKKTYNISTATAGVGEKENSNRTPRGLHEISHCIGGNEPVGRRFIGRSAINSDGQPREIVKILKDTPENAPSGDYILTRILRLKGLDKSLNARKGFDSFERYIYFHGTNEEYLIGTPVSHGCIRMRNEDIVELFALVAVGTPVFIHELI